MSSVTCLQGTLEEAVNADLLLHVIDASSPDADAQHAAVVTILRQLGMTSTQLARKVCNLHLGCRRGNAVHAGPPARAVL